MLCAVVLTLAAGPAAAQCAGDCNGDGTVGDQRADLRRQHRARDARRSSTCASFDSSGNGEVEINELVAAVGFALNACPAMSACGDLPDGGRCVEITPGANAQDDILTALIEAQPKDVIFLHEGTYTSISRSRSTTSTT